MINRRRLYALLTAGFVALLTIWMLEFTASIAAWLGNGVLARIGTLLFSLVMPGLLIGYAVSGNIHVAQTWLVVLANFIFYYGVAYVTQGIWARLRPKSRRQGALPHS
jgi:hypothetical protein